MHVIAHVTTLFIAANNPSSWWLDRDTALRRAPNVGRTQHLPHTYCFEADKKSTVAAEARSS